MIFETIATQDAPHPVGPYSQAIGAGGFLFTAGQIPLDPATGKLIEGGFPAQAERVMQNLGAVLAAAGLTFGHVVRATVYFRDLGDFAAFNEVYSRHMGSHKPARSAVQVAALPLGCALEIDMIAARL